MSKKYFIDSENVGDNWIDLLDTTAEDDVILIFYTDKSPHMNYNNLIKLKQSPKDLVFIECYTGNNALDFQLCTELGYQVHDIGDTEFIIVSNDSGYDSVVKYWRDRKIKIKRILGKTCSHIQQFENEKNDGEDEVEEDEGPLSPRAIEKYLEELENAAKSQKRLTWQQIRELFLKDYVGLVDIERGSDNSIISAIVLCSTKDTSYEDMLSMASDGEIFMLCPNA